MKNTDDYDHLFKLVLIGIKVILLLGDSGVGKTNILN